MWRCVCGGSIGELGGGWYLARGGLGRGNKAKTVSILCSRLHQFRSSKREMGRISRTRGGTHCFDINMVFFFVVLYVINYCHQLLRLSFAL